MAHIERTTEIGANCSTVWGVVSDLENVSVWNPNVSAAICDLGPGGIGATRTCHMAQGGHIDEVVSEWEEGRRVQFAVGNHGGIRSADMGMVLTKTPQGTRVTAIVDYHLAFGPLGPVIDRIAVRRQMAQMLDQGLAGLREHIENDKQEIPPRKGLS